MTSKKSQSSPHHVLIAGAGIGGLVTALSLLHRGIDCDVYEQANELREVGAGLWVSANGARVLFELGLKDELERVAIGATERAIRLWNTGESWPLYEVRKSAALAQALCAVACALAADASGGRQETEAGCHSSQRALYRFLLTAMARVSLKFEDGSEAVGTALIGADGIHSKIREQLLGHVQSRYTNALAWRGLVPVDRLSPHQAKHAGPYLGRGLWPMSRSIPCAGRIPPCSRSRGKSSTAIGNLNRGPRKGNPKDCLKDFEGWHPDIIEMISAADTLHKWGIFVREPACAMERRTCRPSGEMPATPWFPILARA